MVCELECYRWDAILMSETWRPEKSTITNTELALFSTRSGDKKSFIDTEYISERAITTTIVVNHHQRIKLMSVYFSHSGYADRKNVQIDRRAYDKLKNTYLLLEETSMQNWDLVTEPNALVLADTHSTRETKEVIG